MQSPLHKNPTDQEFIAYQRSFIIAAVIISFAKCYWLMFCRAKLLLNRCWFVEHLKLVVSLQFQL